MHSAPPVLVPVGRFVVGARISGGLAGLSLLAALCWLWQTDAGAGQALGVCLVWAALLLLSHGAWRRQALPPGHLHWDGEAWWWQAEDSTLAPQPMALRPVWDGGGALCLQLRAQGEGGPQGALVYAWLRASDMSQAWHALRCAVHQHDTL